MADLIIIYDPKREIATMVNPETQQGWGPAMIGPDAYDALQAFVTATPFDLTLLTGHDAATAFTGFLDRTAGTPAETAAEAPDSPVEPLGSDSVDQGLEPLYGSDDAGEPAPEPGAADTDQSPPPAQASQVTKCYNCEGTGFIQFGGDEPDARCNMCQGTGKILQAV